MDASAASLYLEAIEARHSVRQYDDEPLAPQHIAALQRIVAQCNGLSGLRFQLVIDEPGAFSGFLAHYGTFRGVKNYVALVGPRSADLEERCGYFGEELVLEVQQLGLSSCWVALTYRKIPDAFTIMPDERLVAVIVLGRGATQGKARRSKALDEVSSYEGEPPAWFIRGVEAALLAPTALNQQRFKISGDGDKVSLKAGFGPCTAIDAGIVRFHFECGASGHDFTWV